jgi:hypothetical protein
MCIKPPALFLNTANMNSIIYIKSSTKPGTMARYPGGRDQEDQGSKPAPANSSRDPILKNQSQKRAGGVAQGEGPEFKLQDCKKKKKF